MDVQSSESEEEEVMGEGIGEQLRFFVFFLVKDHLW